MSQGSTRLWIWITASATALFLASNAHALFVFGDFENTFEVPGTLSPGWNDNGSGASLTFTSDYGVTNGSYALRLQPPAYGVFYWALKIEFNVAVTGGAEAIAAIANHTKLALDVTFVEADWTPLDPGDPTNRWVKWEKMAFNSDALGWSWTEIDMTADVDPIRKDYPGSWDPGGSYEDPPGSGNWVPYGPVHTRTFTYDYSSFAAQLASAQSIQLYFAINSGWNFATGCFYVDNIRVLSDEPPPPPPLLGDTNNDGVVDLADYNNVVNNLGATGPEQLGDTNNDEVVDLADYNNVVNNLGATRQPASLAVPEPASLALLSLASLALLRRASR